MCDCDAGFGGDDCLSYSCAKITYCDPYGIYEIIKAVVMIPNKKYNAFVKKGGEDQDANSLIVVIKIAMKLIV